MVPGVEGSGSCFSSTGAGGALTGRFGWYGKLVFGAFACLESIRHDRHIEVREREPRDVVLVLHESVQVGKAGDFGLQDKWLHLAVKLEVSSCASAIEVRFAKPFHFYFADELADPLAGLRLLRGEPNSRSLAAKA